ncbi:UvrD-helicase domain-containing protein [Arthrobacter sp. zg-Y826]|uniref:UvrD-helicase domain-containing protein n=1 Tax=Arthrobacter jinronghuae TaxID=2964609 RepID=UPI0021027E22|nr:UvrD-helicase domain-containing protein [Arthrobacter jinronghuae]MCQ1957001.1 UvrD-helicase domain-containing protein [Arthrobacter jinronghuae]
MSQPKTSAFPAPPNLKDAEDRHVIGDALDTTVFVEAGAGSGKTHALVGRIAALVDGGVDVGAIAAITFTEKAAGELRDRLRGELAKTYGLDELRTERRNTALDRLDAAPIGTIHSFAARLIGEYPIEAGVPPLITVVDELRAEIAFEHRWEEARQALFTDPAADAALRVLLAVGVTLDQLRSVAAALDGNWDRLRTHPPQRQTVPVLDVGPLLRAADLVLERKAVCTEPTDKLLACFPLVQEWRDQLETVRGSEDFGRVIDVLNTLPSTGYAKKGSKKNWGGDVKSVQQQFQLLVEERDGLIARQVSPAVNTVSAVLAEVLLAAAKVRQRSGELEYHDLLVHARDLLVGDTEAHAPARLPLHRRYTHLMLDEFQDTDPVQAEIAVRLAADTSCGPDGWEDLPVAPGRLFMVGDPKQSIYRFRRADIATFLAARGRAIADPGSEVATLQTNFRSGTALLEWINSVFNELIVGNGTVQPPYDPLVPDPARPAWNDNDGPAVVVLGRNGATPDENGKVTAAARNRQEAADVAAAIRLATGTGGAPAWQHQAGNKEGFARRPLQLQDVCILLPTRTALPYVEDALDAAGIEYRAEASSLVYATQEVTDLLLALRTLANTADQAALVLALRSALFACGDDDLFRWKQAGGAWNLYAPAPEGQENSPVRAGLAYLSGLHRELPLLSPAELIERIAADRRVLEAATDTPRYRDVWRRIRFVTDQARAWTEATHGGLRDYLVWTAVQQEENARVKEAMVPETDMQAVRIMTIHASKGLEFPMVVLAGAGSAPNHSPEPALWDEAGNVFIRFRKGVSTSGYAEAAAVEKTFTEAERRRLLYVACTRAESHLVVSHYSGLPSSLSALLASVDDVELAPDLELPEDLIPLHKDRSSAVPVPGWDDWLASSAGWAAESARVSRTSVTALAKGDGAGVTTDYGTADVFHAPAGVEEVLPGFAGKPEEHGTVFGTSLHRLLELTDLELSPSLPVLAADVASSAGLRNAADLEAAARSALESAPVRRAAEREHWLELPIMVPEAGHTMEGIIDLMYREDDGSLVVADFKTDISVNEEQLAAYWRQLGTYAKMIGRITGEEVTELVLIFCRASGAEVLRRTRG